MSLRDELVEEVLWYYCGRNAEAALDAILDHLEAHADKWGYEHLQPPGIRDLIVTLRPPVSSSQENPDA